jgi:hypothetical protein
MPIKSACAAVALTLFMAGAAHAATDNFMATLKGADETPPNDSAGTGMVMATYDTVSMKFHYDITYSGLTGPAMAAHFHVGAPGVGGPPVLPITGSVASPISGDKTLTAAQAADLEAGKWYFNVHTAVHPAGEVRGQVLKQ